MNLFAQHMPSRGASVIETLLLSFLTFAALAIIPVILKKLFGWDIFGFEAGKPPPACPPDNSALASRKEHLNEKRGRCTRCGGSLQFTVRSTGACDWVCGTCRGSVPATGEEAAAVLAMAEYRTPPPPGGAFTPAPPPPSPPPPSPATTPPPTTRPPPDNSGKPPALAVPLKRPAQTHIAAGPAPKTVMYGASNKNCPVCGGPVELAPVRGGDGVWECRWCKNFWRATAAELAAVARTAVERVVSKPCPSCAGVAEFTKTVGRAYIWQCPKCRDFWPCTDEEIYAATGRRRGSG